jgi:hypothetical protein
MYIPGQWIIGAGEAQGMGLVDAQWKTFVVADKEPDPK